LKQVPNGKSEIQSIAGSGLPMYNEYSHLVTDYFGWKFLYFLVTTLGK